jgi:hypothetical protein
MNLPEKDQQLAICRNHRLVCFFNHCLQMISRHRRVHEYFDRDLLSSVAIFVVIDQVNLQVGKALG